IGRDMNAVNSDQTNFDISNIVDENIGSFWVANGNDKSMKATIDLGKKMKVYAVQINFQEFNANSFGRVPGLKHQFLIEKSDDGKNWTTMIDYSENKRDQPHAYIELDHPVDARFVRYRNVHTPNKYLAISEFRIFGKGFGKKPSQPGKFEAVRQTDRRNADLSWKPVKDAVGYVLYWGIDKEKLNNSVMIYGENSYALRALNVDQEYFFRVEAFNENGISEQSRLKEVE
ncbi:MAG: discoidin domain-containing protein, partial [Salegentibacter sp.]